MAPQYNINEIVYAADCGKLHEAKILKVQSLDNDENNTKYFIHYQKWQRKYDTWIDDHLLAPLHDKRKVDKLRDKAEEMWNPSAKREQKALKDIGKNKKTKLHFGGNKTIVVDNDAGEDDANKGKKKRGKKSEEDTDKDDADTNSNHGKTSTSVISSPDSNRRGKRRGKMTDEITGDETCSVGSGDIGAVPSTAPMGVGEPVENAKKRRKGLLLTDLVDEDDTLFSSKVQLPFDLKRHAVDEWSLITKDSNTQRLLSLPKKANVNVRAIFKAFLDQKKNDKNIQEPVLNEYYQFFTVFLVQFDRVCFICYFLMQLTLIISLVPVFFLGAPNFTFISTRKTTGLGISM